MIRAKGAAVLILKRVQF